MSLAASDFLKRIALNLPTAQASTGVPASGAAGADARHGAVGVDGELDLEVTRLTATAVFEGASECAQDFLNVCVGEASGFGTPLSVTVFFEDIFRFVWGWIARGGVGGLGGVAGFAGVFGFGGAVFFVFFLVFGGVGVGDLSVEGGEVCGGRTLFDEFVFFLVKFCEQFVGGFLFSEIFFELGFFVGCNFGDAFGFGFGVGFFLGDFGGEGFFFGGGEGGDAVGFGGGGGGVFDALVVEVVGDAAEAQDEEDGDDEARFGARAAGVGEDGGDGGFDVGGGLCAASSGFGSPAACAEGGEGFEVDEAPTCPRR